MTNLIIESRIFILLRTGIQVLKNSYKYSILGRVFICLNRDYEKSRLKRIWEGFCGVENTAGLTLYGRVLSKIGDMIISIGGILEHSLFYRGLAGISRSYLRITKGSFLFSKINSLTLYQWFLVGFSMYLPLDYIIRTQLPYSVVASLWEEAFIFAGAILILWRKALKQRGDLGRATPLDAYILLFMAVGLLLMSIVKPNPYVALAGYRAVIEYILWFFLVIRLIENDKDFKVVFYSMLGLGALLGFHGIYQYIIGVPIPASWVSQTEMGVRTRVFSLTGSPNILGSIMVMTAPLAASMVYYSKKVLTKIFFLGITGAMALCLLFTFSRGAWVGMVAAVVIFALYTDRRLLGIMGGAMAAALAFVPSITSRLTYLFTSDYAEASAVGGRTLRWETGRMLLLENNPWLGFGLGRFGGAVAMNNKILEETEEFSYFYMDNYYLKTMVEMGYIGIIFYMLMLAGLVIWGLRAVHQSDRPGFVSLEAPGAVDPLIRQAGNSKAIAIGIFSGLMGVLVHSYFENIFEEPYMMAYFWGLAAMLMYLGFFSNNRRPRGCLKVYN